MLKLEVKTLFLWIPSKVGREAGGEREGEVAEVILSAPKG